MFTWLRLLDLFKSLTNRHNSLKGIQLAHDNNTLYAYLNEKGARLADVYVENTFKNYLKRNKTIQLNKTGIGRF